MTIQHFQQLEEMEKIAAILQFGRLISQDAGEDLRVFLYRLDSFYVAASYSASSDQLRDISSFPGIDEEAANSRRQSVVTNPAERAAEF